ncbi:MAG: DUF4197 domain-containing protein [Bacteroidales bacterium]|jgi:hypothetical protein
MKKTGIILFAAAFMLISGCAELTQVLQTVSDQPLTEEEVISGLREALTIGSRNSADILAAENGYYLDETVKVLLPDEARIIVDNISRLPGGEQLVADVILKINRAAEDAAKDVAPIFVNSIKAMTIRDGFNILNGQDNAATEYLRSSTWNDLYSLYKPKIQKSTEKDIIGNISTIDSWNALTSKWNNVANTVAGKLAGLKPVNVDLNEFLTEKALNGVFVKLEAEEMKIRKDASARVTALLKRVFGSLDK